VYRECTRLKFKHLVNYSVTAAATCATLHLFYFPEEQILNCKKEIAYQFVKALATPGTCTYFF
jgi:hypothetical protein